MIHKDMLKDMILMQKKLQLRLKSRFDQNFINIMTLAAIDELMESIRETTWKPWKKNQIFNKENYKNELIDVWHFLINLSIASGMDAEEIHKRFMIKNNKNIERQDNNY